MIQERRHAAILREIEVRGEVLVTDYAKRTGLSTMTIRRDLALLREKGLVERIHGGAVAPGSTGLDETAKAVAKVSIATVGMVVPAASYYYPATIQGAEAAAAERGVKLILGISGYSVEEERRQIRRLVDNGVDGLIVTPSEAFRSDSPSYNILAHLNIPVVIAERSLDGLSAETPMQSVRTDHAHGAEAAVRHLVSLGHRRLALATRKSPTAPLVHEGFQRALNSLFPGSDYLLGEVPSINQGISSVHDSLADFLEKCVSGKFTAAIVLPDAAAVTLAEIAQDSGLSIPEDLSIVAYDDELAALAPVPLTAVAPPKRDVGYLALKLCFDGISISTRTPAMARSRITLLPTLNVRESTGKATFDFV